MKTLNGNDWINVLPEEYEKEDFKKIETSPTNFNIIYASGTKVIKSLDGGINWTDITSNIVNINTNKITRATTAVNKFDPNIVFVLLERYPITPSGATITYYRDYHISYDAGITFTCLGSVIQGSFPNFNYYKMEAVWSSLNPNDIYLGGVNIFQKRFINGVMTTVDVPQNFYHKDIRHLESYTYYDGENNIGEIYFGNDGGVSKIIEPYQTNSQQYLNITGTGLNITQYYGFGIPGDYTKNMNGGTQDGNLERFDGNIWYNGTKGDAAESVYNFENPKILYMVTFLNGLNYMRKSDDGGLTWISKFPLTENRRNDAPLEMNRTNSQKLLCGGKDVYISYNGAQNFNKISDFASTQSLKVIRFAPSNENIIYAAKGNPYWGSVQEERLYRG